ncbi:hypothetical protein GOV13_04185 [Candidatus Pacearchaeota archaeon]|nr:hypothetical protein [Candidatus Pacearchaeota archaeon]
MKDLFGDICKIICNNCGGAFEHPGSCEICLDDEEMNLLRIYEMKVAKEMVKDSRSLYSLHNNHR